MSFDDPLAFPWVIPATGAPVRARWERMFRDNGHAPPLLRIECGTLVITRGLLLEDDWLTLMSRDQFLFERRAGPQQAFVQIFREVCAERSQDSPTAWPFRYP